jgi:hypothetical protein
MKYLVIDSESLPIRIIEAETIQEAAWEYLDDMPEEFDMIMIGHIATSTKVEFLSSESDAVITAYFYSGKDL